jgi:hypothetical protein
MKKNIVYILFAVFALFLSQNAAHAFDGQSVVSKDIASLDVLSRDAEESEIPCLEEEFSVFLAKFMEDETFQRAFTMYPLTYLEVDYFAEPEPKPFIRYLDCGQIKFPVIPSDQERIEDSLEIRIINVSDNNANVAVVKPDTGYNIIYYFRKNGCWRLERIEDWSC